MQNKNSQPTSSHESLIRGSAWMTFGSIFFTNLRGNLYYSVVRLDGGPWERG